MIVEVTVSNIVVDQAAVTHGSKHVSTGTDPIPLGTTSAAGVVQLATTGVEEATKVPKATGADLAALLTAGGYTLTAPSGANSLDGIADTATWKKVAAAVATALNADTYTANDADKVSAFGIGGIAPSMATSLDNYVTAGFFKEAGNLTNSPWGSGIYSLVHVQEYAATLVVQTAYRISDGILGIRTRSLFGSTWTAWKEVWTSYTDGNGGQPPAPKPKAYASGLTQGEVATAILSNGATWTNPGGTWEFTIFTQVQATKEFTISTRGIAAGNLTGNGAGYTDIAALWRIE